MDRRGHHVGVGQWAWVQSGCNEAGKVRHVNPQRSANLVGNAAESSKVKVTRVGRPAGNDHTGTLTQRHFTHLIGLDTHCCAVNFVCGGVVHLAGKVDAHSVCQVAAVSQGQTQNRVPRFCHRHERGGIGLRA